MAGSLGIGGNGLQTAVSDLHNQNNPVPDALNGEQLALLPLSEPEAMQANAAGFDIAPRGVGRPKGSKNKNTEAWREYLLTKYSSPLEVLASTMTRKVRDLAIELGYLVYGDQGVLLRKPKPEELEACLKIQLSCAKELAPYLHQKQPQAIELGDAGLMTLNIFSAPLKDVQNAAGFDMEILDLNSEENQEVSEYGNKELNECELNETQESAENSGLECNKPTDTISVCAPQNNGGEQE